MQLSLVEWSPDGRTILFVTKSGEVHCYDNHGNFMVQYIFSRSQMSDSPPQMKMPLFSGEEMISLAGICWFQSFSSSLHFIGRIM